MENIKESPLIFDNGFARLYHADARSLPIDDESVDCVVTSPPYWGLRDYGLDEQGIGLEATPEAYCTNMVKVFREVWRVLKPTGTVWMNLGDSYVGTGHKGEYKDPKHMEGRNGQVIATNNKVNGLKSKDLVGIPWRVAFALQKDGWYLRSDIIWSKPNPMPEPVRDRPTKAHEYIFLLTKSPKYYYDADAIRERLLPSSVSRLQQDVANQVGTTRGHGGQKTNGNLKAAGNIEQGRNKRSVWEIDSKYPDATYDGGGTGLKGHSGHYKADGSLIDHPLGKNKRTVWEVTTQPYKEAHFATFPEKLVEPCILAGSSEKGVCAQCGKSWKRIVELTEEYAALISSGKAWRTNEGKPDAYTNRQPKKHPQNVPPKHNTIGWEPTCTCNADVVPATVLDPFVGSGTTLAVAQKFGRKSIGTDLNREYLNLAKMRIGNVPLPLIGGL